MYTLGGWAPRSAAIGYGRVRVAVLQREIEKVAYPCLDLSHLTRNGIRPTLPSSVRMSVMGHYRRLPYEELQTWSISAAFYRQQLASLLRHGPMSLLGPIG